jgi:hypothetical protein
MRYAIANILFRLRFPSGGLTACDFRPHWDGFALNAFAPVPSNLSGQELHDAVYRRLAQIIAWLKLLRPLVASGDRVQLIVGQREPQCQLFKGWVSRQDLASKHTVARDGWEYWTGQPAGK